MMEGRGVPVLSVRGLRHEFPISTHLKKVRGAQALRGVDLDLHEGECLGLVGESGSGKTTLARVLLRLLVPTAGSILFRGTDVLKMAPGELRAFRRKVQIVFQDPFGSLNPRLTAGGMLNEVLLVHFPGLPREERRSRVEELLGLVGLTPEVALRYPHEFSGGQRQRLGIARALAVEPEVLLLDEPVSSLDLSVQAQILNLLGGLREALGLTYLFVTHDLSVVRHVAERVAVLYLGSVVEEGPTRATLADPLHPYTRGLLAAADLGSGHAADANPEGDWGLLPGETPSPFNPPTGCALHPRCPHPSRDEECTTETPPLRAPLVGRQVACWKARKHLANP